MQVQIGVALVALGISLYFLHHALHAPQTHQRFELFLGGQRPLSRVLAARRYIHAAVFYVRVYICQLYRFIFRADTTNVLAHYYLLDDISHLAGVGEIWLFTPAVGDVEYPLRRGFADGISSAAQHDAHYLRQFIARVIRKIERELYARLKSRICRKHFSHLIFVPRKYNAEFSAHILHSLKQS